MIRSSAFLAVFVAVASPAFAHHGPGTFELNKTVTYENAKLTRIELINPHSWLYIDVPQPDGKIETWAIEFGSPNVLFRNGWKKDSLPEGMKVTVMASPAKDGSHRANSRGVEFPDGRKLDTGSSAGKDDK